MSEAENSMDTAESTAASTSAEDRFFGVKTQIAKKSDKQEAIDQADLNFEIVDDKPPSDKQATDGDAVDKELSGYSQKVRKRIDKATFKTREAERLAEEAVKAAQHLNQQNQQLVAKNREYESLISRGETVLVSQIKEKAKLVADKAKSAYRKAHEEGNTDDIVTSQEQMIQAQAELQEAERYENRLPPSPAEPDNQITYQQQQAVYQQQQAAYQQQQAAYAQQQAAAQVPEPDAKATEWGEKNSWFGDRGHKGMTAYAYALHEEAIQDNGLSPNSDQYFEYIDTGMRGRFNEYSWSENVSGDTSGDGQTVTSTARKATSVVAPSGRNNGARPRKVKLKPSQIALAKRLGLTNEQYAKQVIKEMANG
jgi:hypothetical protein